MFNSLYNFFEWGLLHLCYIAFTNIVTQLFTDLNGQLTITLTDAQVKNGKLYMI